MSRRRIAASAAAAFGMLAAASPAMARVEFAVPTIHFLPASPANFTVAHRPSNAVRLIVVHVTESSAASAVAWFRNPKAEASANYVVGQDGSITEMVPDSDIAWHAGNWNVNSESIGIEHGGYTYRKGSFTDTEYRASARLVASEMRHYLLPIDRRHIIGHSQVPDPNHTGLFGGFAHHTDPGPYWNWSRYMSYVKSYARGTTPALQVVDAPKASSQKAKPTITATVGKNDKVSVASSGLKDGATVAGFVNWQASVSTSNVQRVEFIVDGRVRATDTKPPFRFADNGGWDTTKETNGAHVLTLRVVTKGGDAVGQSLRVVVANSPFTVAAANLTNGATVAKTVRWEAVPAGASADHVDFLVDGKLVNTEKDAPYLYEGDGNWDTTKVDNGPHTLTMRAVSVDGRIAEANVTVMVQNVSSQPKPKPSSGISVSMNNLWQGAVVSGKVAWTAAVTGSPKSVQFYVDGRWRWTESSAPYVYGGDGQTWDTSKEKAGTHVVTVRAYAANGSLADFQSFTITIQSALTQDAAPGATTMAVVSSVADGATLHGSVAWTATVNGTTPQKVDFYIDGRLRHTEHSAPYEFGTWDTTQETNGAHTLVVRATAADGTTATTTQTVQVSNAAAVATIASMSVADASTVSGGVAWSVTTAGPRADRVEFYVDGKLKLSDSRAPYAYVWDTTLETNGTHTLLARAIQGTNVDQQTVTVTVSNGAQRVAIATDSLSNGQTVNGAVTWAVTTGGASPDSIQYSIDGVVRGTGSSYVWDTTKDADGSHTLVVKATAGDQVDQQTFTVTVRNTESIKSSTIANNATVSGTKTWTVAAQGPTPDAIELSIDGTLVSSSGTYAWDTTKAAEGAHTLIARVTAGAQVVQATYAVTVANTPSIKTMSLVNGGSYGGAQTLSATTSGLTPDKLEWYVDGSLVATASSYAWDTTTAGEGSHTITVKAYAGSLVGSKTISVTVSNTPTVKTSTISSGQTLSGTVTWSVTTKGLTPDRIEYYVDGSLRATAPSYAWDTTSVGDGPHTLTVKLYAGSLSSSKSYTVTTHNAPLAISSMSVADGVTLTGSTTWTVSTNGSQVEFSVDGVVVKTDTSAPFSYTLSLSAGTHVLVAKASYGDTTVTATANVTAVGSVSVTQNLTDGQTLNGTVAWTATPTGSVSKIEFLINGGSAGVFTRSPYGGTLDTRQLANGTYTFAVRATGTDGTVVTSSATVTVQN